MKDRCHQELADRIVQLLMADAGVAGLSSENVEEAPVRSRGTNRALVPGTSERMRNRPDVVRARERRAEARRLREEGRSVQEIAEALGVAVHSVKFYLRGLGRLAPKQPRQPRLHGPALEARREKAWNLFLDGLGYARIAKELGISPKRAKNDVWSWFSRLGLASRTPKEHRSSLRQARALKLRDAGLSSSEIASRLGVHQVMVNLYLRTGRMDRAS